jgi:hypothetical protein
MTAKDGGNAVFAGAKNCPWHRVIPFILNIKSPNKGAFMNYSGCG